MSSSDDEGNNYMEDDEDDTLCKYGTQLPQYEADEIPTKKPLQVEDMVVKDENGRRRFHGAFTGGFSAGYWNTVGSKEGFTPSEFKSSRAEKGSIKAFKPTDFMDEEDFGEFGIAPQKIQTKEDFGTASTSASKRRREAPSDGPIPGEPVLRNLLKPVHDKAAVRILKKMGWRDGQGIGSRMTYSEKKRTSERNKKEMYVFSKYGTQENKNDSEDDSMSDEEITFVPDDFDPFIANIKDNTFGLEYSGLKAPTTSSKHLNLFEPFRVYDKKTKKKFSITGQAFGVGAMEEEDDDIYAMDDMSNYDRTLGDEKNKNTKKVSKPIDASIIEGFSRATINDSVVRVYSVDIPRDFEPRNWLQRKSRFAPLSTDKKKVIDSQNKHKVLGLGRHDLKPEERGKLLNEAEKPKEQSKPDNEEIERRKQAQEEKSRKMLELLNSKQFVSEKSKTKEDFKPFINNPDKQERYEKYLALKTSDEAAINKFFNDIQPLSMSSFEREMEKKEFIQAKRMYQPLDSLIGSRFIKESDIKTEPEVQKKKLKDGKEVIVIERTKVMWKPHKTLCKLFNIPEPFGGMMYDEEAEKKKKKQSSSLFDYIGVPLNTKANFVAPQVIPRKLTEDHSRRNEEEERKKSFLDAIEKEKSFMNKRATAKDFFNDDDSMHKKQNESDVNNKKEIKKIVPDPPKTELEIKVAESIHKKPEEKKDLFKAIFCDSDDEDEEKDDNSQESAEVVQKLNSDASEGGSNLTEKQKSSFIESFLTTKSASEINVLRNASPPRGIFKSIFELGATTSKTSKNIKNDTVEEEEGFYGPALPKNIPIASNKEKYSSDDDSSSSDSNLDEKLLKKLKKVKSSSREKEKWIEKDKLKKSKKSKKKKSHKKSHKKHKSRKSE
ncbi:G patch domain-containing protein 1 homolog [Chironomus tepperi]|uniref:G patch domain-containing protein 1 homolog n=1 Tax=Chironomus tepperi TaxID=113505 RepID=UPI00391EEC76